MSRSLLALRTSNCWAWTCAALSTSARSLREPGLFWFSSTPIRAEGATWRNKSRRFDAIGVTKLLTPVTLPSGRFKLETIPDLTGSSPAVNTIGIVAVAALAAKAVPPPDAMTVT